MKWAHSGGTIALPVKLVSYDKRGHRRLGALTGGSVVDLPDAVGHPVFPTTMEALVSSSGGTVLDAARDALERDDALEFVAPDARLLVPLLPPSIRTVRPPLAWYGMPGYAERDPTCPAGPEEDLPGTGSLELWLACVVGKGGRDLSPEEADGRVFGYTLMAGWPSPGGTSLGPCVVTPDELDPAGLALTARVGGEVRVEASLHELPWSFSDLVAHLSWSRDLCPGDVLGAGGLRVQVEVASLVEFRAQGIGVLRNRIGSTRS